MNLGVIQTLLKARQLNPTNALSLKVGQIFQGKAVKLFREDVAQIQVGSTQFVAKLHAPLILHQNYWFQVQPNDEQTELKVFYNKDIGVIKDPIRSELIGSQQLLNKLGVKATNASLPLIKFLHDENIPFTTEQFQQAVNQLLNQKEISKGLSIVKYLLLNQLPITSKTFHSLIAVQDDSPMVSYISKLLIDLEKIQDKTPNTNRLITMLQNILGEEMNKVIDSSGSKVVLPNDQTMQKVFKQMITSFGLQYENDLVKSMDSGNRQSLSIQYETLKPLLMTALSELNYLPGKETLEHLINRITGQQLLSRGDSDFGHLIFQIPFQLGGKLSDLTIQFSGKKNKDKEIDPNYCQLFFQLELGTLRETMIDVKIQNRILSITIYNNHRLLDKLVQGMKFSLAEGLEKVGYKLSSIKVSEISEKLTGTEGISPTSKILRRNDGYTGVDIKI
ncbi:hypothetical protein IMZ08_11825 [Bacillus luteolus]|uniref:Flagellar hook-length control protein-like C-terminal domain-containing protein n=1 Tax=Litchfieldia luteola TaxID=682179 RepID=A0ABR9QJS0_9BACI|nr:hypothetical protein [Cytobacillus luteolus]MBE4908745.1 hypothetical protein [Cytobacillus luteolus]MBP1941604.1 hypothetical protein [Cytobacillus luteolus]